MGSVLVYETKRRISLSIEGRGKFTNRNPAMHSPDFLVFKDSQTDVEFIVRNVDRKPINLTGKRITATIVDYYSKHTLYRMPLVIVDAERGICRATFTPNIVRDMKLGFHQYTITYLLDNGFEKNLYLDQYDTIKGFFEVKYGRDIEGTISQEFNFDQFKPIDSDLNKTIWISPNLLGNLQNGSTSGLHTLAIYQKEFLGNMWIEGAITEEVPEESDWFPITVCGCVRTRIESLCENVIANNIVAQLQWVRIKILPDETNTGEIKKIMFRN